MEKEYVEMFDNMFNADASKTVDFVNIHRKIFSYGH